MKLMIVVKERGGSLQRKLRDLAIRDASLLNGVDVAVGLVRSHAPRCKMMGYFIEKEGDRMNSDYPL